MFLVKDVGNILFMFKTLFIGRGVGPGLSLNPWLCVFIYDHILKNARGFMLQPMAYVRGALC
jgi:hypothetical protein